MTKYTQAQIKDSIQRVSAWMKKHNHQVPLTVKVHNDTLKIDKYKQLPEIVDARKRVVNWYNTHKKTFPNYVTIAGFKFQKAEYAPFWGWQTINKKPTTSNETFNYFTKVFGKVNTIDQALQKVKEHNYGYYYNNRYSNKQCIDNMKKGIGCNCTDSCQVFHNVGLALGYQVRCLHVQCSGGDGHVRLQLKHPKHTSGNWINRDPAAVLSKNGQPLTYNWCTKGYKLLATNPQWYMKDLNK